MRLTRSVQAWGTPGFRDVLKHEIGQIPVSALPLQQALRSGSRVVDEKPGVTINGVDEFERWIVVRVGIFFAGIDAGSCCADDPSAVEPHAEYCVVQFKIDRTSGDARVSLLDG